MKVSSLGLLLPTYVHNTDHTALCFWSPRTRASDTVLSWSVEPQPRWVLSLPSYERTQPSLTHISLHCAHFKKWGILQTFSKQKPVLSLSLSSFYSIWVELSFRLERCDSRYSSLLWPAFYSLSLSHPTTYISDITCILQFYKSSVFFFFFKKAL